jgi:diaminopimelate epimerase
MQFTKLQGAGNDYIYVNGLTETRDWAELSRRIADRHFGVGADGLIVVTASEKAPVRMRMFNADGSEGEMCGNGIRCFAKYVLERNLVPSNGGSLDVETGAGVVSIVPHWEGRAVTGARVDMGTPILCAADVPAAQAEAGASDYTALNAETVKALGLAPAELLFDAPIAVDGVTFVGTAVSMGNPHFVCFVDEPVSAIPLEQLGPLMEHHAAFPKRVNFHVVNLMDRTHIVSRTWERGSGLTLACGTGASAMVVAARLHGLVDDEVSVRVPGGELTITWAGHGSVMMDGDAVEVFSGELPD